MRRNPAVAFALILLAAIAAVALTSPAPARADTKTLRIALNQDLDILDPNLTQAYVTGVVMVNMCERLYGVDPKGAIVPVLASAMPTYSDGGKTVEIRIRAGMKFNDGTPADAQAVKFSIERGKTLKGSTTRSDLERVTAVEAVDARTVRIKLDKPFPPLTATLATRVGSVVSPTQIAALGDKFNSNPVCVGPWKFVSRVPQDRIILERSPYYYDPGAVHFDRLVFSIIPDDAVRIANLRSGDIDLAHLVPPTDAKALKSEGVFTVSEVYSLGYQGITINLANQNGMSNPGVPRSTPLAGNPKVREAFDYSIDRDALNQVVSDGTYTPDCTAIAPQNPLYPKGIRCPKRDIAKAKLLLTEAGFPNGVSLELTAVNDPLQMRVAQVLQSMAADAGIHITINPLEFASSLAETAAGRYEAFLIGWSGRPDPDGNLYLLETCSGAASRHKACDPDIDALLTQAREAPDVKQRIEWYRKATERLNQRRSIIELYHPSYIVAFKKGLKGYSATPDGLIQVKGVSLQ
jgi:peptide/nickel transport system substrate-binding protein